MRQRELIDYCTDDANRCNGCPYDAECDVYFDMYGTTPACEERNHPERYTDEDIGLMDKELAIREQSTIQPEPAIPLSWIDEQIERLKGMDNAFATLTALQISGMVKKWRDEQNETD